MALYRDKGFPAFPGAYIINKNNTTSGGSFPIYKSTPDLGATGSIGASNTNDYLLVMPGYRVTIYVDINYGSTSQTFNNTDSTSVLHSRATSATWVNTVSSIKLFYGNTEII
jgi:hypothetical protein